MDNTNSSAVRDYYDALFENVDFYFQTVREEIGGFQQEINELKEQLAGAEPGTDKDALSTQLHATMDDLENRKAYLSSDRILAHGIEFSADILDDDEPEMTDQMLDVPGSEKYAYLTEKFSEIYKRELAEKVASAQKTSAEAAAHVENHKRDRPSAWENAVSLGSADREWGKRLAQHEREAATDEQRCRNLVTYSADKSLVDRDSEHSARKKIGQYFPDVRDQYFSQNRQEFSQKLQDDPAKLYADLIEEYSNSYCGEVGDTLSWAENDLAHAVHSLEEHDGARPGVGAMIASLGKAQGEWEEKREGLLKSIEQQRDKVERLEALRQDVKGGWLSEAAREVAKATIKDLHSEVVEACDAHMKRGWQNANNARLEQEQSRQAERDNGAESSNQQGLSR